MRKRFALGLVCMAAAWAGEAQARILRIEIARTEPAFGGPSFGDAGAYERLIGRALASSIRPIRANAIIQDLNLAPRNARGMVEYTTDIESAEAGATMARGNRILFFEVNNRGNKLALIAFNEGVAGNLADRNALTSPGDGWLMRAGYTMVWFGWEMDVRAGHEPRAACRRSSRITATARRSPGVVRSRDDHAGRRPRAFRSASASKFRTIRPTATTAIRPPASTTDAARRTASCRP